MILILKSNKLGLEEKELKNPTGFIVRILTYSINITISSKLSTFVTSNHVKVT